MNFTQFCAYQYIGRTNQVGFRDWLTFQEVDLDLERDSSEWLVLFRKYTEWLFTQ